MIVNEFVRPWLADRFKSARKFPASSQYQKLIRIAQLAAEKAKIDLSSKEETAIFASDEEIRVADQDKTDIYLDVPIKRAQMEALIRPPVMQTIDLIRNLLTENNYKNEDVDRIVFIGGPSRIPLIRQLVRRTWHCRRSENRSDDGRGDRCSLLLRKPPMGQR